MKRVKLFEEFINESKGLELVHAYDKDGTMYGTGELVKKQGSKSLIRFDSETEKWFDNKDIKLVESKYNGNVAGDAAEYIAKELSQYVKGIINQSNNNVTYFHLKDKSYKSKVIKTLKDIYGLDAQDGGTQFSPSPTIKFDNDVILESNIDEATTSWSKMMKGVKGGDGGPWSLVAIEYGKVVGQKNSIKVRDILPAEFEEFRKQFPKAKIHIEDAGGGVVWNESIVNEAQIGDKLTKKFTEETGISVWDKVTLKSESGIWVVARLWAPKDDGGMNPGLHIELTKGSSREHFQVMDDNGNLSQFGKEITKK
jgi:hypothetical protein